MSPLSTSLISVRLAGAAELTIVQTTASPGAIVTLVPVDAVSPVQLHALGLKPAGPPDSDNAYVPTGTSCSVTAAELPAPVTVAGPDAVRVQSEGTAVPPPALITLLIRVRVGCTAVLVIEQVTSPPLGTTTLDRLIRAPVHDHCPAS